MDVPEPPLLVDTTESRLKVDLLTAVEEVVAADTTVAVVAVTTVPTSPDHTTLDTQTVDLPEAHVGYHSARFRSTLPVLILRR